MSSNFEDMIDEIASLIEQPQTPTFEYRLYYDEYGQIYATANDQKSADTHLIFGSYIVVDEDIYLNSHNYMVENGKSVWKTDISPLSVTALKKSNAGFSVLKNNAALLLDDDETVNSEIENYDYRTR